MGKETVLILGATSDVGKALATIYNSRGYNLILAGRKELDLNALASTLPLKENASIASFDALDFDQHTTWFNDLDTIPDIAICVFGYLGDQNMAMSDWKEAHNIIDTNYTGAVSVLNVIANEFQKRKTGIIAGISSVGGDRGRQSNFIYGSAKAGFSAYLSGLRNRLFREGVHVLTVKPGFINTKMTAGLNLPKPITASPEQVAECIYRGIDRKKNVIYVLPIWFWIMLIIKSIPEFIFKRLKL
jgi:short-subunit dehydrogenase